MRARTLIVLTLFAGPACAQTVPAPAPDEAGPLAAGQSQQITVTANRAPTPQDDTGSSVTVLTRSQIEADQETQVVDLLARTPGVSVDQTGGVGQTASVFIRGGESRQTLVLIDGVPVNDVADPGTGFDFSNLLTGDIGRIEVLRGPQSTLYGSAAIGGVVNIVTDEPTRPFQGSVQAEGGSFGTAYESVNVGGAGRDYTWRLGGAFDSTDGISAFDRAFGGRELDPFHGGNGSARATWTILPGLQLDERVYYVKSRTNFDGYDTPTRNFGDDSEYNHAEQLVDYTGLNFSLLDGMLKNRVAYTFNETSRQDYDPDQPITSETFATLGRADRGEYEGTLAINRFLIAVFGAEAEHDDIKEVAPSSFEPDPAALKASLETNSGYAQLTATPLPGLSITGGARLEDNSSYGTHATGQVRGAYVLPDKTTILRASWGQGYKAPSLYELYSEYGTPSLRPEQAQGWDAGVEQHFLNDRLVLDATYFGRKTTNLIDFVSCFGVASAACAKQPFGYYDNVASAIAEGVELAGTWRVTHALSATANYTYDDSEDASAGSATDGLQLPLRPRNTANATVSYVWPVPLTTSVAVRYADSSFDDAAHTIRLKSYEVVDLRASYLVRKDVELYGRVENLTNERYEVVYQYGTLGRAVYGGVRVGF